MIYVKQSKTVATSFSRVWGVRREVKKRPASVLPVLSSVSSSLTRLALFYRLDLRCDTRRIQPLLLTKFVLLIYHKTSYDIFERFPVHLRNQCVGNANLLNSTTKKKSNISTDSYWQLKNTMRRGISPDCPAPMSKRFLYAS